MNNETQQFDDEATFEALDHPDLDTEKLALKDVKDDNTCTFCRKIYKSKNLLQRHKGKRHKEEMKKLRQYESNKKMTEWRKSRAKEKTSKFDLTFFLKKILNIFHNFRYF